MCMSQFWRRYWTTWQKWRSASTLIYVVNRGNNKMKIPEITFEALDNAVATHIAGMAKTGKGESNYDLYGPATSLMFGCNWAGIDKPIVTVIGRHLDSYAMLDDSHLARKRAEYDSFGITVNGWAAPMRPEDDHDEIKPSQHPSRIRVHMFLHCDKEGNLFSSMRMADRETVEFDFNGSPMGPIQDAMIEFNNQAMGKVKK